MQYTIVFLGFVSFFMDLSTEMVSPLIPLYLTATLGATPFIVGIIEGIAESLASLLKVFSGYLTDKYQKKKPLAFLGYSAGVLYKVALLFTSSWTGILSAKIIDRIGKGVRTSPRDVLVSESGGKNTQGKAFGIHKALDMAGSALGILISFILIKCLADNPSIYKIVFAVSMIPALLSLLCFIFIKEKQEPRESVQREKFWKKAKELNSQLKLYLLIVVIFTLGNSSNSFLLLRAKEVGFTDTSVLLLYFLFNTVAALLSISFGKLSDKIGRKKLLVGGYILFAVVYLGFGFSPNKGVLISMFALYGIYTAMTAGVERALIAELSPPDLKGTMLGLHSTVVGIALLPASLLFGLLSSYIGYQFAFSVGSGFSIVAALLLIFFFKPHRLKEMNR